MSLSQAKRIIFMLMLALFAVAVLVGCATESNGQADREEIQDQNVSDSNDTNEAQESDETNESVSDWPERPINIIVGFGAGGGTDLTARTLGELMAESLGVEIAVSNMEGGTGGIAADHVQQQPKDGYTLLGNPESLRILAVMDYHPTVIGEDWLPLIAAKFDGVISVPKDSRFENFSDLVEEARSNPNTIDFSASSSGTVWHIQSQIMNQEANVPMNFIPYQGSHPAQTAALQGEVEVVHTGIGEQSDLIKAGELKPLAVFSNETYEMEDYGTIPPVTEELPELESYLPLASWLGISIPTGVPDEIVEKIESAYLDAVNSEEFEVFVKDMEGEVLGYNIEKSLEVGTKETSTVSWLLYDLGIAEISPEEFNIPKP